MSNKRRIWNVTVVYPANDAPFTLPHYTGTKHARTWEQFATLLKKHTSQARGRND